jgi:hypothetical protein
MGINRRRDDIRGYMQQAERAFAMPKSPVKLIRVTLFDVKRK